MPVPATPRALVRAQTAIESFSLAPDGSAVVYALRQVVSGAYRSHVWQVAWDGGRERQLTRGAVRDATPAVAPDGRTVAFVRGPVGDAEEKSQVWILPRDGGEAWQLTRQVHGASRPVWSPDGRRLAFLGEAGEDRFAVGLQPRHPKRAPTARHITRLDFFDDTSGLLGRRTHLWVVAARPGARPRRLTDGDFDVSEPAWSPDGRRLAFVADVGPDWNIMPHSEIFAVPVGGGPMRRLASLASSVESPVFSPDGRHLAFRGHDVEDRADHEPGRLWVTAASGRGEPRCLTPDLDRPMSNDAWADLVQTEDTPGPVWLSSDRLAVIVADRARSLPYLVPLAGGAPQPLVDPDRLVSAGIAHAAGRMVLAAGRDGRGAELLALDPAPDAGPPMALRPLTRRGSAWQDRFPVPQLDEAWVDGPGGPIQTWVASPVGAGSRRLPAILVPHGGPTAAHGPAGRMDAIMLCAAGYRVLMPNIRGSTSFGSDWVAALGGRWGDVDVADVHAVFDGLIARGLLDPDRLGVMGLSYGGYLVQALVGSTDRLRAAVAENGVANQLSAWGTSYFGVHYNRRAGLGDPLTPGGVERAWSTSPLRDVASIRTPLLMLQAEEDRNCPASDNQQLFAALTVLGREVEYVLYPEEHHDMKDVGRPDRRIDRMERILAWFDRWMGADAARARRETSGSGDRPARRRSTPGPAR